MAALLRKLHIEEFTKSRPRRSNDNALVESKNASVVRRYLGYDHIPRHHAALVNDFLRDVLAPFLNYHRPCHFPVETTDAKGRIRKTYPFDKVTTPYLKLKSLDGAALCLRPAVTFEQLYRRSPSQTNPGCSSTPPSPHRVRGGEGPSGLGDRRTVEGSRHGEALREGPRGRQRSSEEARGWGLGPFRGFSPNLLPRRLERGGDDPSAAHGVFTVTWAHRGNAEASSQSPRSPTARSCAPASTQRHVSMPCSS